MQLNDVSNIANTTKTTSFDMVLWIILFVSLICKILSKISEHIIIKHYTKDKSYQKQCIHYQLNSHNKFECVLPICNNKYYIDFKCNRKACPGYRISTLSFEELKKSSTMLFVLFSLAEWLADLSAIILIAKNLLN